MLELAGVALVEPRVDDDVVALVLPEHQAAPRLVVPGPLPARGQDAGLDVGEAGIGPVDAVGRPDPDGIGDARSEEHTSELQSLMRISYAVFCLTNKTKQD